MKKILVVEDDPVNLMLLSDFLSAHGYAMLGAVTGPEGVESYLRDKPDLMLVDVQLPRKNGFEVCSDVKAAGGHVPILLMSAVYSGREHHDRAAAQGQALADGYLLKPFDLAELLARVRGLIGLAA